MFTTYFQYIKDNPKGYWFKARWYGWGWTPVRWQGWLVTLVYLIFVIWTAFSLPDDEADITRAQLQSFWIKLILSTMILIFICYRTGEKPRWQWGPKKNHRK